MTCACSRSQSVQRGQTKTRFRPVPGKACGKPPCPNPPPARWTKDSPPSLQVLSIQRPYTTTPQKAGNVELEGARGWRLHVAGGCERWAACGRRLCAATPWMIGRARLEAIRGGPVDDGRARLEAVRGGPVNDGRARLRPCAADPWMIGRVRLEAMRDWSLCTVSKFGVLAVHHFRR